MTDRLLVEFDENKMFFSYMGVSPHDDTIKEIGELLQSLNVDNSDNADIVVVGNMVMGSMNRKGVTQ